MRRLLLRLTRDHRRRCRYIGSRTVLLGAAHITSTEKAGMSPTKSLVIVESPHKATMIAGYLGPKYTVRASQGHVRALPTSASAVPAK